MLWTLVTRLALVTALALIKALDLYLAAPSLRIRSASDLSCFPRLLHCLLHLQVEAPLPLPLEPQFPVGVAGNTGL